MHCTLYTVYIHTQAVNLECYENVWESLICPLNCKQPKEPKRSRFPDNARPANAKPLSSCSLHPSFSPRVSTPCRESLQSSLVRICPPVLGLRTSQVVLTHGGAMCPRKCLQMKGVVWLSQWTRLLLPFSRERQGHWTSYRTQTVPSKMPAVPLWTNTSQGPHGTDRERKPREGLGPAAVGMGTGKREGSRAPAWNPRSRLPPDGSSQRPAWAHQEGGFPRASKGLLLIIGTICLPRSVMETVQVGKGEDPPVTWDKNASSF